MISVLPLADDDTCATFCIENEGHTLANPLRFLMMKNKNVSYCSYSIPHPSESKVLLRVQTNQGSAMEALKKGLEDLIDVSDHMATCFQYSLQMDNYPFED